MASKPGVAAATARGEGKKFVHPLLLLSIQAARLFPMGVGANTECVLHSPKCEPSGWVPANMQKVTNHDSAQLKSGFPSTQNFQHCMCSAEQ